MTFFKSLFTPHHFIDNREISTPTTKNNHVQKSHMYLDRIKLLQAQNKAQEAKHKEEIEKLNNTIKSLNIALSLKVFREVTEEKEKKKKVLSINRNTIANFSYLKKNTLQYVLGHDEDNNIIIGDLSKDPHLLISGKTGSGKSITTFNILMSVANNNNPKNLKISLIDPKLLSFGDHRVITSPFLNEKPSIGDNEQALKILQNAYNGMMKRYRLMLKHGVKDYRKIGLHAHVIFIDEVFELLEGNEAKEILSLITRIASLGRAGGVHLVLATQSPRAKTLSGTLKANLEFIGHKASNTTESNLIGLSDAHRLKGKGDGLRNIKGEVVRFQATFLDIESDQSYIYLNPKRPKRTDSTISTQNAPKTAPKHQPNTKGLNTDIIAFKALLSDIIGTVDETGKLKPKSYFIDTKKREDLKKWNKAINLLCKEKEVIYFKNGIGYFLNVDYDIALNILKEF